MQQSPRKKFSADTVLEEAIELDPSLTERLAACHSSLERLRDPGMGRVLSRLLTFKDLAGVTGINLNQLLEYANGETQAVPENQDAPAEEVPSWFSGMEDKQRLDVRPLIAEGRDPFNLIMAIIGNIESGDGFILDAPFEPVPLRRVLREKGFISYAQRKAHNHWQVYFLKEGEVMPFNQSQPNNAKEWQEGEVWHIDVRGLQAPEPMLAILRLIEKLKSQGEIMVHHEREPFFLYPELEERGWSWEIVPGEPGEVRLHLKGSPS